MKEKHSVVVFLIISAISLAVMIIALGICIDRVFLQKPPEPIMDSIYQCNQCNWKPQPAQQVEAFCYHCGDAITDEDIIGTIEHQDIIYDTGEYTSVFICPECNKRPDTTHRCGVYCPYCGSKMQYKE